MSGFRPLLAASIEDGDTSKLLWPMIGSPKIDGIRIFCHYELGPITRSLKPVGNSHIRDLLTQTGIAGLDGEVVVGNYSGAGVFERTTGAVRAGYGTPDFTYWVFDHYPAHYSGIGGDSRHTYGERLISLGKHNFPRYVKHLEYKVLTTYDEALQYEAECLERGFEGIMLRSPTGLYKHGRSTFKEQILIKVKRFKDDEATIVGFEELFHNQNQQTRDQLGLADRSSHKAGLVAAGTLGALTVSHPTFGTFNIGSGFDSGLRLEIWSKQDYYRGQRVTFKYQPIGTQDKPRFPIFMRFRSPE